MIPSVGTLGPSGLDLPQRRDGARHDAPERDGQVTEPGPDPRHPHATEAERSAAHDRREREAEDREARRSRPGRTHGDAPRRGEDRSRRGEAEDGLEAEEALPGRSGQPDRPDALAGGPEGDFAAQPPASEEDASPPAAARERAPDRTDGATPAIDRGAEAETTRGADPVEEREERDAELVRAMATPGSAEDSGSLPEDMEGDARRAAEVIREIERARGERREAAREAERERREDERERREDAKERLADRRDRAVRAGAIEFADITRRSVFDKVL